MAVHKLLLLWGGGGGGGAPELHQPVNGFRV